MTQEIETPSGKGAADENFPVGSWLLPAPLRPHVATFYAFARAADDIADNSELEPDDKVNRLEALGQALKTGDGDPTSLGKALQLRASLIKTGVTAQHALDLLEAFKLDARKLRYETWDDLMGYCALSASPVGRYLLDLHCEDPAGYAASDPLCKALQVLNHLQDCGDDCRRLNRVYLPQDWMHAYAVEVDDLLCDGSMPGMRRVLDLCLDGVQVLLESAETLPVRLRNRRFAMESAVILRLAWRLHQRLRRYDPIAGRVALSKFDFLRAGARGIWQGWRQSSGARGIPARAAGPS